MRHLFRALTAVLVFLGLGLSLGLSWPAVADESEPVAAESDVVQPFGVTRVTVSGPISPAQAELLDNAVAHAERQGSSMVLLVLDTPGGLGDSMRSMVSTILNAPMPVAVWVGPAGARAASAGVFLVAASSVAGMAPQTTIGAASPVGLGGAEIDGTMAKKVTQDFTSLVRAVSEARGRNSEWYSSAVTESVSITANEALEARVVEMVAQSDRAFLVQAGRAGVLHNGATITFDPGQIQISDYEPGFRYSFLSWLLHPQVAYLLLMCGMLGLFIEITNPGSIFPGVFGGLCLLLGLYAMSVLPTDVTGLLLLGFALLLFLLEIQIVSYGLLSLAGAAAMFIGSVLLFRDDYGTLAIPTSFIILPVAVVSSAAAGLVFLVVRSRRVERPLGLPALVGQQAEVLDWDGESGQILIRGEIWAAKRSSTDFTPQRGMKVQVLSASALTLEIGPLGS